MKRWLLAVCAFVCLGVDYASSAEGKGYGMPFDVNLDHILNNKRLLDAYTRCYLDRGPCPGPSREAKKNLPEIFKTNCKGCTSEQKQQVRTAFNKLKEKRPGDFKKIFEKYNPGNTHLASFNKWLKS